MVDGIGEITTHQPALQQSQKVSQPATTEANTVDDPNQGNRTKALQEEAIRQHVADEAAKRNERGQELNITV